MQNCSLGPSKCAIFRPPPFPPSIDFVHLFSTVLGFCWVKTISERSLRLRRLGGPSIAAKIG